MTKVLKLLLKSAPQFKNEIQGQKNEQLALSQWNISTISEQYITACV